MAGGRVGAIAHLQDVAVGRTRPCSRRASRPRPPVRPRAPHGSEGRGVRRRRTCVAAACSPPRSATTTAITSRLHRHAERERVAESLDALVAPDDQAHGERAASLQRIGDPRLDVAVELAGPERLQRLLERQRRVVRELAQAPTLVREEAEPEHREVVRRVDAEGRLAVARDRRARGAGRTFRRFRERAGLEPRHRDERHPDVALGLEARRLDLARQGRRVAGRTTIHSGLAGCPRSTGFVRPPVSHATDPACVRTTADAPDCSSQSRTSESFALRVECSSLPNGISMIANTRRLICRCQP